VDIAVVILAIPLIAGRRSMVVTVLLIDRVRTAALVGIVLGILVLVMALTLAAMLAAARVAGLHEGGCEGVVGVRYDGRDRHAEAEAARAIDHHHGAAGQQPESPVHRSRVTGSGG
jgi:hypothetical protein